MKRARLRPRCSVFLVCAALLVSLGCNGTYETRKTSDLDAMNGRGPLRVLTIDSVLYTFDRFSYTDTDLSGSGTVRMRGSVDSFSGSLPFHRIAFIERTELSVWKGIWVLPIGIGVFAYIIKSMQEPPKFQIERHQKGSCPYVYAFDGHAYRLEGEAFGTSVSRAFEAETFNVLPSLTPTDGVLRIRMSNERPETHLINCTRLYVGDAGQSKYAVLDVNNELWPVLKTQLPETAADHSGNNILAEVSKKDARYWKSDLTHTMPLSGFRDEIQVNFERTSVGSEATIVVDAINSDLITMAYRSAGLVLGDETMEFYNALERDTNLQGTIRDWIRECNLRIEMEEDGRWKEIGMIPPEATVAPFSRAIRIGGLGCHQGPIRLRLSSLTDVWRIDAVTIDYSDVRPIALSKLDLVSVRSSDKMDWRSAIESNDSSYALILPPATIDLTFDGFSSRKLKKPVYVFAAKGYLYEWLQSSPTNAPSQVLSLVPVSSRVELFKQVISHKDQFLPSIYADWRRAESPTTVNDH